jgi:hypothetical protein
MRLNTEFVELHSKNRCKKVSSRHGTVLLFRQNVQPLLMFIKMSYSTV